MADSISGIGHRAALHMDGKATVERAGHDDAAQWVEQLDTNRSRPLDIALSMGANASANRFA